MATKAELREQRLAELAQEFEGNSIARAILQALALTSATRSDLYDQIPELTAQSEIDQTYKRLSELNLIQDQYGRISLTSSGLQVFLHTFAPIGEKS